MEVGDVVMTSPLFSLRIRTKGVFRQKNQRTKDIFSAFIRSIRAIRGRFSSERNYHNYHNYPRNIIKYGIHSLFRVSDIIPFLPMLMISISKDFRILGSIHKFILRTLWTLRTISRRLMIYPLDPQDPHD